MSLPLLRLPGPCLSPALLTLLPAAGPPGTTTAAKMSSKRAKAKTTKKRPQRATSNVFAMFDQSQIQEFKEAFNMIDQNRDGFIDKEDLHDMLASLGEETLPLCSHVSLSPSVPDTSSTNGESSWVTWCLPPSFGGMPRRHSPPALRQPHGVRGRDGFLCWHQLTIVCGCTRGQQLGVLLLQPCSLEGKRPLGLEKLYPRSNHQ